MMTLGHHLLFGCHVAGSDVAPGFHISVKWGGGELSHLGSSSLVSVHGCWLSFVSGGVICVHFQVFFIVSGCAGGCCGL